MLDLTAYAANNEELILDCETVVAAATPTLRLALLYCYRVYEAAGGADGFDRAKVSLAKDKINAQQVTPDHEYTFGQLNDNWRRPCGLFALLERKLVTFASDGAVMVDTSVDSRKAFLKLTQSDSFRLKDVKTAAAPETATTPDAPPADAPPASDELTAARDALKIEKALVESERMAAAREIGAVRADRDSLLATLGQIANLIGLPAGATFENLPDMVARIVAERDAAMEKLTAPDNAEPTARAPQSKRGRAAAAAATEGARI